MLKFFKAWEINDPRKLYMYVRFLRKPDPGPRVVVPRPGSCQPGRALPTVEGHPLSGLPCTLSTIGSLKKPLMAQSPITEIEDLKKPSVCSIGQRGEYYIFTSVVLT